MGVCSSTPAHAYPALLQGLLGDGFVVGNYGNSGKTMLKRGVCGPPPEGDCAYWDTDTYPAAVASQPDIVTIMLGTNVRGAGCIDSKSGVTNIYRLFGAQGRADVRG